MNADSSLYSLPQLSQTTPVLKKYYKSKIQVKISYKTTITILYVISLWDADLLFLSCQVF